MDQCKRDGCGSYAINDHKESGLCDKCYWIDQAEKLTAERDKLKAALEKSREDINWMLNSKQFLNPFVFDYIDDALKEST